MRVRKKRSAHPVSIQCHAEKEKEGAEKERESDEGRMARRDSEERGGTVKRGRATLTMNNTGNF